jgi:uncharacterized membrane protein
MQNSKDDAFTFKEKQFLVGINDGKKTFWEKVQMVLIYGILPLTTIGVIVMLCGGCRRVVGEIEEESYIKEDKEMLTEPSRSIGTGLDSGVGNSE